MPRKKILIYINSLAPAGGLERVVTQHANYFSNNYNTEILSKDKFQTFFVLDSSIRKRTLSIDINFEGKNRFLRIFKIIRKMGITIFLLHKNLKLIKPDFIYVGSPLNLFEIFISTLTLKNVIVTEHASHVHYNVIYKLIIKFLYPHVFMVACPNKSDIDFYMSIKSPVFHIPNPLPFFPPIDSTKRSKLALNIGRLVDDKDHLSLIHAWHLVMQEFPEWRLRIIGQGGNKNLLVDLIYNLSLQNSIEILDPTDSILEHYLNSSIFLLTSKSEGFGMVLIEAMACGLPCIAFDCPVGPRDIIVDGSNGYLISHRNIESYSDRIKELIRSDSLMASFRECARGTSLCFKDDIIFLQWDIALKEAMKNELH